MNTSLFVGLCEDAGLSVRFDEGQPSVYTAKGEFIATVSESALGRYLVDTHRMNKNDAVDITELVVAYAYTPIEERE